MVNAVKFLLPLFFFFYFFSRCLRPSSFKDEERRKPRTHKTHSPHTYTHQRTGLCVCSSSQIVVVVIVARRCQISGLPM